MSALRSLVVSWFVLSFFVLCAGPGSAAIMSGTVVDPLQVGVFNVDVDVHDSVTGQKLPTQNDSTDQDGTFDIVVPAGTYDLVFNTPKALRLVSLRILSVTVAEPTTTIGVIPLEQGVLLSGRVVRANNGSAVAGVDTDVDRSVGGERVITPDDDTDLSGDFSVVAPFGLVDLTVEPISDLAGIRRIGLMIVGDLNLGVLSLENGFFISGTVRSGGIPLAGVEFDAFEWASGVQIPTPDSRSSANGSFALTLPPGMYTLKASPPIDSGKARLFLPNHVVAGNQFLNLDVPSSLLSLRLPDSGRVVVAGTSFRQTVQLVNNSGVPQSILALVQVQFPQAGISRRVFPPLLRQIPGVGVVLEGRASIRIPGNLRSRFREVPLHLMVSAFDASGQTLIDVDLIEFQVK